MSSFQASFYKACYYGNMEFLLQNYELVDLDTICLDYACLSNQEKVVEFLLKNKVDPTMEQLYICVTRNHTKLIKLLGLKFDYRCIKLALENGHWELVKKIEESGLNILDNSIALTIYGKYILQYIRYKTVLEKTKLRAARVLFDRWPRKPQRILLQDF